MSTEASGLAARAANITISLPNQKRLEELDESLSALPPEHIREAVQNKTGDIYAMLSERSRIARAVSENRLEVAKLLLAMLSLGKEQRNALASAVRAGILDGPLHIDTAGPATRKRIAQFMRRCGIGCRLSGTTIIADSEAGDEEVRMLMGSGAVWVSEEVRAKLEENMKKMRQVVARVQLRNAERQVRHFSDQEEKDFENLQHEYLTLLKEQDELLRGYHEEENPTAGA